METSRIIVTGGHGFYGRHIVPTLNELLPNCQIFVLDNDVSDQKDSAPTGPNVQSFLVDITSEAQVKHAVNKIKPDAVIHTAGINPPLGERYSRRLEQRLRDVNVGGTRNVLAAAIESGCRAFVYTSSCCVVTDDLRGYFANIDERWPLSRKSLMYGESKVEAEELVLAADGKDMATCVLRPAVTFGEGGEWPHAPLKLPQDGHRRPKHR